MLCTSDALCPKGRPGSVAPAIRAAGMVPRRCSPALAAAGEQADHEGPMPRRFTSWVLLQAASLLVREATNWLRRRAFYQVDHAASSVCYGDGSLTIIVSKSVFVVGEITGSGGEFFDGSYHGSFSITPSLTDCASNLPISSPSKATSCLSDVYL